MTDRAPSTSQASHHESPDGERAPVKMWLFPYLTIAVIVAIVAVLILMAFDPDQQQAIFLSLISAAFIIVAGVIVYRRRGLQPDSTAASPSGVAARACAGRRSPFP